MQLFKSGHCTLTEIRVSGKKQVAGILCFKGLPSVFGSKTEILALEDGVVLSAGRCVKPQSRMSRIGSYVCISGRENINITYGRLAKRFVNTGDFVKAGDVIGIEGASGSGTGEYLTLEFRRNNRRIDGCEYLGIPKRLCEFYPPEKKPSAIVTKACNLNDEMRSHLDNAPFSALLWEKLLAHLSTFETTVKDRISENPNN